MQKLVLELSGKLAPITDIQKEWGFKHCFEAKGYATKKNGIFCLMCGHRYKDNQPELLTSIDGSICPECGAKLKVFYTTKHTDKQLAYYGVITAFQGFQVTRVFELSGSYRIDERARLNCSEVVQMWIHPKGKHEIVARCHSVNWYHDYWKGEMVIRDRNDLQTYAIYPYRFYPKMKVIPEIRRNGFRNGFYDINPFYLFKTILTNPKAETLLKAGQTDILKHAISNSEGLLAYYWDAIKICIRQNYSIKNASTWCDYIDLLKRFGKDIRNAKYVCPVDLKAEHDRLVKKQNGIRAKEAKAERMLKAQEDRIQFFKLKKRFLNINISDGSIHIVPLKDPEEYVEEGMALHHCVGSSSYYLKPNTLILSARIDNKPIETIEVSLNHFEILQSRGVCNENSEYHEQIIQLVRDNMFEIKKRAKKKSKKEECHASV